MMVHSERAEAGAHVLFIGGVKFSAMNCQAHREVRTLSASHSSTSVVEKLTIGDRTSGGPLLRSSMSSEPRDPAVVSPSGRPSGRVVSLRTGR